MKVRYIVGDLLSVQTGIIVHGCNARGKMGKGVALAIRNKYPSVYKHYLQDIYGGRLFLGEIQYNRVGNDLYIVNAITQDGYGSGVQVDYDAVYYCFLKLFSRCTVDNTFSVSVPKTGIGFSGGDFSEILQTIYSAASDARWGGTLNIYTPE